MARGRTEKASSEKRSKVKRQQPTALDLFAGAGGLTVGLQRAGFRVAAAIEIDDLAADTYTLNHPEVELFRADIRSLSPRDVARQAGLKEGSLDLVAGCPPCQGFSTLRTMNGSRHVEDLRNSLVLDYVRFVRELRPKALLMENVPGLLLEPAMAIALDEIEELGYPVAQAARVLDAADFGVPQRRRRLVMVAMEGKRVRFAPRRKTRRTVADAIADLPPAGTSGDELHDLPEKRSRRVMNFIRDVPADGGSRSDLPRRRQLACHRRSDGFKDVYGRMGWSQPAPTITTGCYNPSKGRFIHPVEDRAITMREAALLQGFPPDYKFSLARGKAGVAEMVGNALPPPFVEAHARQIRRALNS